MCLEHSLTKLIQWQDFEKEMAEKVRKKFDVIEAAFYDRKSTGKVQIDEECLQWSTTFPHLM